MFVKPFRTKSNVAIKGSERKRLRLEIAKVFDNGLSDEQLRELVPNKEEMTVMKLYSNKGENLLAYCLKKNPIMFEHEKVIYPSVYMVWKHPDMLPTITTQPQVIYKLFGGADLMLPGVILPPAGLPRIAKGQVVAVNAQGNRSPLAVGYALMSSKDMLEVAGMRGKGIKILHTFGDHLWMAGDKQQPPQHPSDEDVLQMRPGVPENEDNEDGVDHFSNPEAEELDTNNDSPGDSLSEKIRDTNLEDEVQEDVDEKTEDERPESEIMDEVLHNCFMTAIKKKLKDAELPILTSTFYRTHVLQCCPADRVLDIKKSSHKKLGKYLRHVASTGLIQVKELSKGNDSLVMVDRKHVDYRTFKPPDVAQEEPDSSEASNTTSCYGVVTQRRYEPPEISVVHTVSGVSLPLFSTMGYKKGAPMTIPEIRETVTKYVREHDLVDPSNPRSVILDPLLHRAMYDKAGNDVLRASWEDVFKKVISKLQPCHQLKFKGLAPILKSGSPPSIKISVQQRAGNKKVTLIDSLEAFLIDPQQFADSIRKKAQASTTISNMIIGGTNKTTQQVQVQGNQVSIIENMLTGPDYQIPRRYLKGLENAPKAKRKGR